MFPATSASVSVCLLRCRSDLSGCNSRNPCDGSQRGVNSPRGGGHARQRNGAGRLRRTRGHSDTTAGGAAGPPDAFDSCLMAAYVPTCPPLTDEGGTPLAGDVVPARAEALA